MNSEGKKVSLDDLIKDNPEATGSFLNEDGESTFDLRSVTPEQLVEMNELISTPCAKISDEEIDQIEDPYEREWSKLFNGRIPFKWHKTNNQIIHDFLYKIKNLPIEFTKKYIPADWITAVLLTEQHVLLNYMPDFIVNCTLRPIDVLLIHRHLETNKNINLSYSKLDRILLRQYYNISDQSVKPLLIQLYPQSPHLFWNVQKELFTMRPTELLEWVKLNESRTELKEFDPVQNNLKKVQEFLSQMASEIKFHSKNPANLDIEITLTPSESPEHLNEELVKSLLVYPNYHWSQISILASLQKMTIPQNTVIFSRILEQTNPGQEIYLAALSQLSLGTNLGEIEKSLMLASYYKAMTTIYEHTDFQIFNKTQSYINILENITNDGNIRNIIGDTYDFIKEFFRSPKKLNKDES